MASAKPRLELWGTFDLDNLGDQLFPVMVSSAAASLAWPTPSLAGAWGGPVPGWSATDEVGPPVTDVRRIVPVGEAGFFDQCAEVDALLVPGGDVVTGGVHTPTQADGTTAYYRGEVVAREPLLLTGEIPVGWHAVGVVEPFDIVEPTRYAGELLTTLTTLTVRDPVSVLHLRSALPRARVRIAPDSVWALPSVWPEALLTRVRSRLVAEGRLPSSPYLVVHSSFLHRESQDVLEEGLRDLVRHTDVVALSIAPCHGDDSWAADTAARCGAVAAHGLTVPERVAVLAGAQGYIGSAFHGGVIAASYAVPTAWLRDVPKTRVGAATLRPKTDRIGSVDQLAHLFRRMEAGGLDVDRDRVGSLRRLAERSLRRTLLRLGSAARSATTRR